ncbi:DUF2812 domain-containing protein [Atopostipes suicloacalis]|nr:DUF2812 domain-containing protein [Atopostipes suicloacalis]
MNFKIEINYLNIDNYPIVEAHLEDMASNGWLIHKIFAGTIFIYKRIEAEELDFSISPYEIETAFTRKTKVDLEEFHTVSKNVGWDYATKSYDLHVYFKPKESKAVPIHTDEEEEFKTLEFIAKKYLRAQYILLPFLIFLSWWNIGSIINNIHSMKNGYTQIASLLIPFAFLISIIHIIDLKKFLKKNRKNTENGDHLEFRYSNQWINKALYSASYIIFLSLIVYSLYSIVSLKNTTLLIGFLPVVIGFSLGTLSRIIIKPIRKGLGFKVTGFIVTLILAFIIGGRINISNFNFLSQSQDVIDPDNYKVLTYDSFSSENPETKKRSSKNASFLIPSSYDYTSFSKKEGPLRTEYSKALTESLARNLVSRYIQKGKNSLRGNYSLEIEQSFIEKSYNSHLANSGFTEEDYNRLRNEKSHDAIDKAEEILFKNSVTKDDDLWHLDETYFLNYEKDEVVLRNENEVFYLSGLDFSDPAIVNETKAQLNLDE